MLLLAFVRLLSERSVRIGRSTRPGLRRERRMTTGKYNNGTVRSSKGESRSFLRYLLETVWAYGTGVMAAHWLP